MLYSAILAAIGCAVVAPDPMTAFGYMCIISSIIAMLYDLKVK